MITIGGLEVYLKLFGNYILVYHKKTVLSYVAGLF